MAYYLENTPLLLYLFVVLFAVRQNVCNTGNPFLTLMLGVVQITGHVHCLRLRPGCQLTRCISTPAFLMLPGGYNTITVDFGWSNFTGTSCLWYVLSPKTHQQQDGHLNHHWCGGHDPCLSFASWWLQYYQLQLQLKELDRKCTPQKKRQHDLWQTNTQESSERDKVRGRHSAEILTAINCNEQLMDRSVVKIIMIFPSTSNLMVIF